MSRRPRPRPSPPGARRGAPPPPARPRGRRFAARALVLAAVAAVAVAAVWLTRGARAPQPADPLATLDPEQAYRRGVDLARAGHYVQSVPYFRRAADTPGAPWQVRHDYSSSLHNAAMESRTLGRVGLRAVRSSVERVAMVRESLRQLDLAEPGATSPRDRAFLELERGSTLSAWGFPLEAAECYRRAVALGPATEGTPGP